MPNITTTEVNDSIPTIVAAAALGYLKANTVLARLVNRDYDNEVAVYGQTVDIPFAGSLSANDKSANTVVTLQAPADTKKSVTLNNHKEVSFLIEDPAKAFARPDWISRYMADGMAVLAESIDASIAALYSGFSQTIDATSGLAEDDFREARRQLNAAKAPTRNRVAVLHEDAEYAFLAIEKAINTDYRESLGLANAAAYQGRFMGFDVVMDQMIAVVAGTPNTLKNMFFHRDAIVLATRPLPMAPAGSGVIQEVMAEDGIVLRVTMSYNPNHLGVQVTIDALWGVAELRDNHGVVVTTNEI